MNDLYKLRNDALKKFSYRNVKNVIIQRGPRLYSLDSMRDQEDLLLSVKKINLEKRPVSAHYSLHRLKSNCSAHENLTKRACDPGNFQQYRKQNYFTKNYVLKSDFLFEQNPFQNEGLKSPLIKKSAFGVYRINSP